MPCSSIDITQHAFVRALERGIDLADAIEVVKNGEVIAAYPDDKPYPSRLMLGFGHSRQPLHVVVGESEHGVCSIITVYRPEAELWDADFKTRKTP